MFSTQEDFDDKSLEDGKKTKFYWEKFLLLEWVIGALIAISFIFSLLQVFCLIEEIKLKDFS